MKKWKVGDILVSKVTQYATQYEVTAVLSDEGRQVVTIAIEGRELHGRFGSDLFEEYALSSVDDTRSYLDAITSDVERN